MDRRDYYSILGVSRSETSEGIREAYLGLAQRYHPDRAGAQSTPFFQCIVEAYRVLSDPVKRACYDQGIEHSSGRPVSRRVTVTETTVSSNRHADPLIPLRSVHLRGVEAIYPPPEELFERFFSRRRRTEELQPVELQLALEPEQAAEGGVATLAVPVFYPCSMCRGTGREWLLPCLACMGRGMTPELEPVRVPVRPMIADGAVIELPVRGLGVHDLFLRVHVRIR